MRRNFLLIFLFVSTSIFAQDYVFDHSWKNLGPEQKPLEDRRRSSNGIGPIEFIRASQNTEGLLIAGSLNGGLFYTTDGGEQWINSGSDEWPYSGCGWAEFHPTNDKVWFANSVQINDNGGPGDIGHQGGIYRTKDAGLNWELVADKSDFINSEYLKIFGFTFHPDDDNRLIVFTAEGFYETKDCLAENIKWSRIGSIGGFVYDMKFSEDKMYISQFQHGKWNVWSSPKNEMDKLTKVDWVSDLTDPILNITLEPYKDQILILLNFDRKNDEMYRYDISTDEHDRVLRNQRVIFGHGRTMKVNPHNTDHIIVGYSTTMLRWSISEKAKLSMKGGYHVDIEGIEYDPFDPLKIYIATHGGVYTSTDYGDSWNSTSKGIGIAEVEGFAVAPDDPDQIAIGCYHDGSSFRTDFGQDGIYQWKNINGGDGLLPILPGGGRVVYTSNQFRGGGVYISSDSGRTITNIHQKKGVISSGWQMAYALHPLDTGILFFNYQNNEGAGKGNMELGRTDESSSQKKPEVLTDFQTTHKLERYSVYGVFTSEYHPNKMWLYVIHFEKQEDGSVQNKHKVFMTHNSLAPAEDVKNSWVELEVPRNDWIGDIEPDRKKAHIIYLSYVAGDANSELTDADNGFIYALKYHKKKNRLKREADIGRNIPYSFTGKYNLTQDGKGGLFFGTREGVFYGDKKTMKGKRDWQEVGFGVPHCKCNGIYYHNRTETLTIGSYGRGVWRYYLNPNETISK